MPRAARSRSPSTPATRWCRRSEEHTSELQPPVSPLFPSPPSFGFVLSGGRGLAVGRLGERVCREPRDRARRRRRRRGGAGDRKSTRLNSSPQFLPSSPPRRLSVLSSRAAVVWRSVDWVSAYAGSREIALAVDAGDAVVQ